MKAKVKRQKAKVDDEGEPSSRHPSLEGERLRGLHRRLMKKAAPYSFLTFTLCLFTFASACDSGPDEQPQISPDTARRELFLRGYSYKEDVFQGCAKEGEAVCVKLFAVAGMSPEIRNEQSETPLLLAARFDRAKAARALLESGADVNARDRLGVTPLMRAVLNGSVDTVKTLLEFKPDLSAQTTDPEAPGSTALMYAVAKNRRDVAELLLGAGADVNQSDGVFGPALAWAAYYNHEEVAALLLDRGADPNAGNRDGDTPLMYAAARGGSPLVQLLVDRGADPSAKNKDGKTVLKWAEGRPEVVKMIRDAAAAKRKPANANNADAGAQTNGR
jgi:ankyrin repeat protein